MNITDNYQDLCENFNVYNTAVKANLMGSLRDASDKVESMCELHIVTCLARNICVENIAQRFSTSAVRNIKF